MGRSSSTPAAITKIMSKTYEMMPVNNKQHVKSSKESQPLEFRYQSARMARAKRRNSKPSANSGRAPMVAGEPVKTLSIFSIADIATPVWSLAGGNAAAPKQ